MVTSTIVRVADWTDTDDRNALKMIRRLVFIEEQNVPEELEWDIEDATAIHCLAIIDNNPVACARLQQDGQIGRMAVLPSYRNRGIGRRVLDFVLDLNNNKQKLFLNAQTYAIPFYEKAGFQRTGTEFLDAGIPHYRMEQIVCQ